MKKTIFILLLIMLVVTACGGIPMPPTQPTAQAIVEMVEATRIVVVTATPAPTEVPPTATLPAPTPPDACRDGELGPAHQADTGDTLSRLSVAEVERVSVLHLSWPGEGFAGMDRVIVIAPRLGPVWQLHTRAGLFSLSWRAFCGTTEQVVDWAAEEVESLRRASANTVGEMPPVSEIPVFVLNYEEKTISVVTEAPDGPTAAEVLEWIELGFSENGNTSAVPLHVGP